MAGRIALHTHSRAGRELGHGPIHVTVIAVLAPRLLAARSPTRSIWRSGRDAIRRAKDDYSGDNPSISSVWAMQ